MHPCLPSSERELRDLGIPQHSCGIGVKAYYAPQRNSARASALISFAVLSRHECDRAGGHGRGASVRTEVKEAAKREWRPLFTTGLWSA